MDTFDDFLNAEMIRLNEFNQMDSGLQALGLAASKKLSSIAGIVSRGQSGAANLKAKVQEVVAGFKTYCGEQRVKYTDARLEDFIDYMRTTYMPFSEDQFKTFAYGKEAGGDAPNQSEIDEAMGNISRALGNETPISPEHLAALKDIASNSKQDRVSVQFALWKLYRSHPSAGQQLIQGAGADLVGTPLSAEELYKVATAMAQLLLKSSKAMASGDDTAAGSEFPKDISQKLQSEVFTKQLPAMKLDLPLFRNTAIKVANAIDKKDFAEQERIAADLDRRFNKEECATISRILLQFFVIIPDHAMLDKLVLMVEDARDAERLDQLLSRALLQMRAARKKGTYDGAKIEKELLQIFRQEKAAAKLLALMIYSTFAAISGY